MLKNIFLIRHAQAETNTKISDFDRKLTVRGNVDAVKMSQRLFHHKTLPKLLLSSPARRALNTAKAFIENLHLSMKQIQPENMLYEASTTTLLSIINHLDNVYSDVAIFGHNPGISELVPYLSDESVGSIPTCGIVQLQFLVEDWKLISKGSGYLEWQAYPNEMV